MRRLLRIEELTGRLQDHEVPAMLETLQAGTTDRGTPVDICLASNILEVGVDIDRLSLMGVVGQPKTTSQYIQVTGRVGRSWRERPGLILSLYSPSRPRDRSHFERFRSYHQRLYAQVEPTSVTPFSRPALERALHAVMAIYARQVGDAEVTSSPRPYPETLMASLRGILENHIGAASGNDAEALAAFHETFDRRASAAASVSLAHAVASTADSVYGALSGATVSVTVVPTGPSIQVVQLGVTTSRQELRVPEGGSNSYSVVLSHVPTADVTLTITDPTDNTEASASPDSLTFTTSNWNTAQTVTVSAAEDDDAVADPVATVTHSLAGGGYDDVTVPDVEVTIIENDSPSIVLSAVALSVGEGDTTGKTYTVKLATQPSASVTVTVSGHASSDVSVDDTSLTFTTSNWNTAQTVTVKAAEDADAADDTVTLTHTAAGGDYAGLTAPLAVTVDDDDTATLVLSETALTVDEGDTAGRTYTVKLSHVPTASVTVTVSGHAGSDVSVDDTSLTFTIANWNTAQTVTVTAVQDADTADDSVTLTHTAAGAEYDAATAALDVTVDDTTDIGVSFDRASYSATEGGSSATVTVELSAPAPRQVEIPLTAAGHDGATQDDWSGVPVSLTFDVGDTSASFTVTAFDDTEEDNGEMVELGFGALPSGFVAGTPAIARVTLINDDETVISDCGDAIWCATVTFRTFGSGIVNASMSDSAFVYGGVLYEVGRVRAEPSLQPGVTPSPPFRIPERSWFSFNFYECRTQQSRSLPDASLQTRDGFALPHVPCNLSTHNHHRDWTLFIEYDAVSVALPFDVARQQDSLFRWYGQEFYDLHAGWTPDKQYQLRIVETPGRQPSVSGPPLYLNVSARNDRDLRAEWVVPVARDDRIPQVDSYKIQWKEASGNWDSPADVSEATFS